MRFASWSVVVGLICTGCALIPESEPEEASARDDLDRFTVEIREAIVEHDWQAILSASDPAHYRAQVVDLAMEEPQYLAELFGLHRTGNDIQEGDDLDWEDLDRIESVTLAPSDGVGPPFTISGTAILTTGEELELRADVTMVQGRLVLTGPVG